VGNRQEEGAANATINRELETLGKMLKLAYENNKLMRLPIIHKLAANPPKSIHTRLAQRGTLLIH
jgi:hypothetical protein